MQINSAVNLAGLCTPLNSKAESSFLVYISDYCTVIKECRGGNICFRTLSTHSTARGEEIVGVCVCCTKRGEMPKQNPRIAKGRRTCVGKTPFPAPLCNPECWRSCSRLSPFHIHFAYRLLLPNSVTHIRQFVMKSSCVM